MDKKSIMALIIGLFLGAFPWIGDQFYNFAGGKVTGIVNLLIRVFPFLNSVYFFGAVYYVTRLILVATFIYVVVILFRDYKSRRRQRKAVEDNKTEDKTLPEEYNKSFDRLSSVIELLATSNSKLIDLIKKENSQTKYSKARKSKLDKSH